MPRPGRSQESPAQAFPAPSDFHHTPLPCPSLPPLPHRRSAAGQPFRCRHPGPILAASPDGEGARPRPRRGPSVPLPTLLMFPLTDGARPPSVSFPPGSPQTFAEPPPCAVVPAGVERQPPGPTLSMALARGSAQCRANGAPHVDKPRRALPAARCLLPADGSPADGPPFAE